MLNICTPLLSNSDGPVFFKTTLNKTGLEALKIYQSSYTYIPGVEQPSFRYFNRLWHGLFYIDIASHNQDMMIFFNAYKQTFKIFAGTSYVPPNTSNGTLFIFEWDWMMKDTNKIYYAQYPGWVGSIPEVTLKPHAMSRDFPLPFWMGPGLKPGYDGFITHTDVTNKIMTSTAKTISDLTTITKYGYAYCVMKLPFMDFAPWAYNDGFVTDRKSDIKLKTNNTVCVANLYTEEDLIVYCYAPRWQNYGTGTFSLYVNDAYRKL